MKKYTTPEFMLDNAETGVVLTSLETDEDTNVTVSGELDLLNKLGDLEG